MRSWLSIAITLASLATGLPDGQRRLGPVNRRSGLGPQSSAQERNFLDEYELDESADLEALDALDEDVPLAPQRPRLRPRPAARPSRPESGSKPFTVQLELDCRSKTRTLPHEEYCDLYYYTTDCNDGQALLRSCPNGLLYTGGGRHGLVGVCDYPHNVDCGDRQRHTKSLVVPDVTYCDRYWDCLSGAPELYDCPNGLVWVGNNRGIADGCDYPWRNPSICLNKDLANPPIATDHCDWLYGIFGHETSCTRYWTCWNGTATEQFCVGGLLYNEETHACDWPQNVGGCQKHPLCKDNANANVPLGKSCNRYWSCQGGYPRLQRCPAMLVFDRKRKRCVSPPTDDCDVPPTEAPQEEDEENDNDDDDGNGNGNGNGNGQQRRRRGQQGASGAQPLLFDEGLPFQLPEGAVLQNRPNVN